MTSLTVLVKHKGIGTKLEIDPSPTPLRELRRLLHERYPKELAPHYDGKPTQFTLMCHDPNHPDGSFPVTEDKDLADQAVLDLVILRDREDEPLLAQEVDGDPRFCDPAYRKRRAMIGAIADNYVDGPIPTIEYNKDELFVWKTLLGRLRTAYPTTACSAANRAFTELNFQDDVIPQLEDLKKYLQSKSGFTIKPAPGLVSSREFLNALADKIFYSTQYVRHPEHLDFSPEPDVCHEILGHVPLLADPAFAALSQQIGLASLEASDEDIDKLAKVYFFSVECGLVRENGKLLAYGAALLSSLGELQHAVCGPQCGAVYHDFDPLAVSVQPEIQDNTYQPVLFVADSFEDATEKLKQFSAMLKKGENIPYEKHSLSSHVLLQYVTSNCGFQIKAPRSYVGFTYGNPEAPITIECFVDFVCPFSRKAYPRMREIANKYKDKVKFRMIVWSQPWHAQSSVLGLAALGVARSNIDAYWKFCQLLFDQQAQFLDDQVRHKSRTDLGLELATLAQDSGIKRSDFFLHFQSPRTVATFKLHQKYGRQNGIHASPCFMVNGLLVPEASSSWSLEQWEDLLGPLF